MSKAMVKIIGDFITVEFITRELRRSFNIISEVDCPGEQAGSANKAPGEADIERRLELLVDPDDRLPEINEFTFWKDFNPDDYITWPISLDGAAE